MPSALPQRCWCQAKEVDHFIVQFHVQFQVWRKAVTPAIWQSERKQHFFEPDSLFIMITDEREESLREVAALGNIKAVSHFIQAGVNVNAANKMNDW